MSRDETDGRPVRRPFLPPELFIQGLFDALNFQETITTRYPIHYNEIWVLFEFRIFSGLRIII